MSPEMTWMPCWVVGGGSEEGLEVLEEIKLCFEQYI